MSKPRIVYIVSLVILAALIGFTMLYPVTIGNKYSKVTNEQLLKTENEYLIQFDISNHDGEDKRYTVNVLIDNKLYTEEVLIPGGRKFTYVHHVYPDMIKEDKVTFVVYREGEPIPIEQVTHYVGSGGVTSHEID